MFDIKGTTSPVISPRLIVRLLTGIGAETFAGNCNITKAKVTKLIRDAGDLKGGDLDAAVSDVLDGLVDTAQNKPSITQVT